MAINDLEQLIKLFSKLPGLGPRSAQRVVLHMLKDKDKTLTPLMLALQKAEQSIQTCETCGNLDVISPCHICASEKRDPSSICVVQEVADLWAFERGKIFNGTYHVLGGVLSAINGVGPEQLKISTLVKRAGNGVVKEVIIATSATVEGQTTAHYISERLKPFELKVTRLAQGIPMGGELDYMDEGTLLAALRSRQAV
ncbi:MAG: recombination protein RecR [Proteobacteria bacterium]|nr:recombination protein RecR [Pseudomonadota bacterium]